MSAPTPQPTPQLIAQAEIGEALTRLAIARGGQLDDTTAEVYLDRLGTRDPALVRRACERLAEEPRRPKETALPDVGTVLEAMAAIQRADAAESAARRLLPLPADDEDGPRVACLACQDGGWRLWWCPGAGDSYSLDRDETDTRPLQSCGRPNGPRLHAPHGFADRCACVDWNPVIARDRARTERRHAARRAS